MLLFNMAAVSLVILSALSVIYFVTYGNVERENQRRLEVMSSAPFSSNRPFPSRNGERFASPERFSPDYRVSFVLFIKNGWLENVNSNLDFGDDAYEEAFEKTDGKPNGKVTLDDRRWVFLRTETSILDGRGMPLYGTESQYERIVFLDVTNETETLNGLLVTLSCVGLAVLLALLWFSYHFAIRAVRPIEESYNKQKQFVADASHELKTPLAIIGANIDAIETSAGESVESQKEWFGYIHAELKRTGKLVDDLLYLTKTENVFYEKNTPFNLSFACESACASMEAMLYDGEIRLDTKIKENIFVTADGEKITQVVYILLDNAGKYTPRGGCIEVSLGIEHEWAIIRVSNTGNGIAAKDLSKIFDRFYRPDASRSQDTGGFGLGLSIAKTIVERSGGEISVESGGGTTTFTVRLNPA
jgi:signal transduction histidine kinase